MVPKTNGPDLHYSLVIRYLESRYPGIREKAYHEFCELVEPTFDKLSGDEKKRLRELSSEWLIFDRQFEDGESGLHLYCKENPDHRGRGFLKAMEESEKTAFSGVFLIEHVDAMGRRVHLRDSSTGKIYSVYDNTLSSTILPGNGGILMTRIVCVRGKYYFPGNPVGYLPIKVNEDMKEKALKDYDGAEQSFVDIARMVFSRPLKKEDLPKFPEPEEIDISDAKAVAEYRAKIKDRYTSFAAKHKISLSWESLVDSVTQQDGSLMPHIMLDHLLGDEVKSLKSQEDLMELSCIWSDLWNYCPQDILGGLTPLEMSAKHRS